MTKRKRGERYWEGSGGSDETHLFPTQDHEPNDLAHTSSAPVGTITHVHGKPCILAVDGRWEALEE